VTDYIVTCVSKTDTRFSDCRCITHVGVQEYQGATRAFLTREQAYQIVAQGRDKLFVQRGGNDYVPVEAVVREGTRYVRTDPDDTTTDNLLAQPQC